MDNGHEPATKQDIELLRSSTKQDIGLLTQDIGILKQDIELLRTSTKQDMELLRSSTKEDMGLLKEEIEILRSEMSHAHNDLKETMRDIQTELLKAFYNYSQTNDLKLKDSEASDFMARQRLSVVESRITEIERRLNMPPQQNN
jgi:hypothetical protein